MPGLISQTWSAEFRVVVSDYPSLAQERGNRQAMSQGSADARAPPLAQETGARRTLRLRNRRRRPM